MGVDELRRAFNANARDELAANPTSICRELESADDCGVINFNDTTETLREQSTDRIDVVVVEVEPEKFAQVFGVHARADSVRAVVEQLRLRTTAVVLIHDFTDKFFDDVFESDQTGDSTVFVDDDGDVCRLRLHESQGVINLLGFRHKDNGSHHAADLFFGPFARVLNRTPGDVTQIHNPANVFVAVTQNRYSRISRVEKVRCGGFESVGRVDGDHVNSRYHDLAHNRVVPFEYRVDERAFVILENVVSGRLIHHAQ